MSRAAVDQRVKANTLQGERERCSPPRWPRPGWLRSPLRVRFSPATERTRGRSTGVSSRSGSRARRRSPRSGAFLPGSPINSNSELAALTQPGRVMDPTRIVVGSRSNFGAPKANADQAAGSFLSIDPRAAQLAVPRRFASAGDQASVLGGAVQMYSAQSPAWLNGVYAPLAVTANQTAVSNPLGMSINNAFGRLWPANAPTALTAGAHRRSSIPTGAR